jgi:hypothetical protein
MSVQLLHLKNNLLDFYGICHWGWHFECLEASITLVVLVKHKPYYVLMKLKLNLPILSEMTHYTKNCT